MVAHISWNLLVSFRLSSLLEYRFWKIASIYALFQLYLCWYFHFHHRFWYFSFFSDSLVNIYQFCSFKKFLIHFFFSFYILILLISSLIFIFSFILLILVFFSRSLRYNVRLFHSVTFYSFNAWAQGYKHFS